VILVLIELLSQAGNVLKRVEDWYEVGQGLSSSIICVDDDAKIFEVVLKSDGERFGLNKSWSSEIIVF
jgi:hypothetical protein